MKTRRPASIFWSLCVLVFTGACASVSNLEPERLQIEPDSQAVTVDSLLEQKDGPNEQDTLVNTLLEQFSPGGEMHSIISVDSLHAYIRKKVFHDGTGVVYGVGYQMEADTIKDILSVYVYMMVAGVYKGSPAEDSGVLPGERVVSVQGSPTCEIRHTDTFDNFTQDMVQEHVMSLADCVLEMQDLEAQEDEVVELITARDLIENTHVLRIENIGSGTEDYLIEKWDDYRLEFENLRTRAFYELWLIERVNTDTEEGRAAIIASAHVLGDILEEVLEIYEEVEYSQLITINWQ